MMIVQVILLFSSEFLLVSLIFSKNQSIFCYFLKESYCAQKGSFYRSNVKALISTLGKKQYDFFGKAKFYRIMEGRLLLILYRWLNLSIKRVIIEI